MHVPGVDYYSRTDPWLAPRVRPATPLSRQAFDALTALVARNSTRPELIGLFVLLSAEATDTGHPAHA